MDESTIISFYRDIVQGKQAENKQLKQKNEELTRKLKVVEGKLEIQHRETEDLSNCPVCFFVYNQHYRLPVVGTCGHTVCSRCARSLRKFKSSCPTCRGANSFCRPAKNFLAHDLLEHSNLFPPTDNNNTILALTCGKAAVLSRDRTKWIKVDLKIPGKAGEDGSVHLNGEMYLFGGRKKSKTFHKLDKNLKWIRLANMNIGRKWIANSCLAWNGSIWAFGGSGRDGNDLKNVEKYDPKTDKWTLMPGAKKYGPTTIWKDRIITRCEDPEKNARVMEYYNSEDGSGIELPHLFSYYFNDYFLLAYKEKLVAIGWTQVDGAWSNVSELDPQETKPKWRALPPMPHTEGVRNGVTLGNEIYTMGGKSNCGRVQIFDGMEWREGPSLPDWDEGMSAVIIPQDLADRLCNYKPQ